MTHPTTLPSGQRRCLRGWVVRAWQGTPAVTGLLLVSFFQCGHGSLFAQGSSASAGKGVPERTAPGFMESIFGGNDARIKEVEEENRRRLDAVWWQEIERKRRNQEMQAAINKKAAERKAGGAKDAGSKSPLGLDALRGLRQGRAPAAASLVAIEEKTAVAATSR